MAHLSDGIGREVSILRLRSHCRNAPDAALPCPPRSWRLIQRDRWQQKAPDFFLVRKCFLLGCGHFRCGPHIFLERADNINFAQVGLRTHGSCRPSTHKGGIIIVVIFIHMEAKDASSSVRPGYGFVELNTSECDFRHTNV